jgi:O-antigen/teichoic acid export membrane protein
LEDLTAARRKRRQTRATATSLAAIIARIASIGTSFLAIPLTITYLDIDQYGLLVSLTALTSMLVFADLGLGNGLLNILGEAVGQDDEDVAARAVSSAFFMLLVIAVTGALVAVLVLPAVPFSSLFHLPPGEAAASALPAALTLFGLFLLGIPLGIIDRVRLGYQEGYLSSVAAIAGGVGSLLGLLLAIANRASLPALILAISAPPLIATCVNGLVLFRRQRPWLFPRISRFQTGVAVRLARLGFQFLILQLAVAVAYQSDVVIAAGLLGPAAAATYAVTLKFFMAVPIFVSLYLAALWPAYGEAIQRGDSRWIRGTFATSVKVAVATTVLASSILIIAGPWVIGTWTGGAVNPPLPLLIGAGIWSVVYAAFNAISMLLNAASMLRVQVAIAAVMALASVGLSVLFGTVAGLSGIVWGTLTAYILFAAIPLAIYLPRALDRIAPRSLETV